MHKCQIHFWGTKRGINDKNRLCTVILSPFSLKLQKIPLDEFFNIFRIFKLHWEMSKNGIQKAFFGTEYRQK